MDPSFLNLNFVLLLCAMSVLRPFWPQKDHATFVALGSTAMIGIASPQTAVVLAGITLLYLYPLHRLMRAADDHQWPQPVCRGMLWLGVALLVLLLVVFKLDRYLLAAFFGGPLMNADLLRIIGFSYFIFRAISFLNIQSLLRIKERTPWPVLAYTLFPPTISSGPIQKYQDFREQIAAPAPISWDLVLDAGYRMTRGYFRKGVVAFVLNEVVTKLLADELTILTTALLVLSLYLYFYFDFAGYSDLAIGFGLLLGIRVPENFRKPFAATTISEFWRNWHITLVDWFRDHVFIPLGGMRSARPRAAVLAFFIMLLCGLWHGFVAAFVVWGIWHGSLVFLEAILGLKPIPPSRRKGFHYWSRLAWTNACVALGSVLFLPEESIWKIWQGFTNW